MDGEPHDKTHTITHTPSHTPSHTHRDGTTTGQPNLMVGKLLPSFCILSEAAIHASTHTIHGQQHRQDNHCNRASSQTTTTTLMARLPNRTRRSRRPQERVAALGRRAHKFNHTEPLQRIAHKSHVEGPLLAVGTLVTVGVHHSYISGARQRKRLRIQLPNLSRMGPISIGPYLASRRAFATLWRQTRMPGHIVQSVANVHNEPVRAE
jgi:hypothetical protein